MNDSRIHQNIEIARDDSTVTLGCSDWCGLPLNASERISERALIFFEIDPFGSLAWSEVKKPVATVLGWSPRKLLGKLLPHLTASCSGEDLYCKLSRAGKSLLVPSRDLVLSADPQFQGTRLCPALVLLWSDQVSDPDLSPDLSLVLRQVNAVRHPLYSIMTFYIRFKTINLCGWHSFAYLSYTQIWILIFHFYYWPSSDSLIMSKRHQRQHLL